MERRARSNAPEIRARYPLRKRSCRAVRRSEVAEALPRPMLTGDRLRPEEDRAGGKGGGKRQRPCRGQRAHRGAR
eukprot:1090620-Rhodomonas_salina.1